LRGHFEAGFGVLVDIHLFGYWGLRHAELSFEAATAVKQSIIRTSACEGAQDRFSGPRVMAGGLPRCMELN
jgi:hypothetical protein